MSSEELIVGPVLLPAFPELAFLGVRAEKSLAFFFFPFPPVAMLGLTFFGDRSVASGAVEVEVEEESTTDKDSGAAGDSPPSSRART